MKLPELYASAVLHELMTHAKIYETAHGKVLAVVLHDEHLDRLHEAMGAAEDYERTYDTEDDERCHLEDDDADEDDDPGGTDLDAGEGEWS